jgi:hypothetical protein
MDDMRGRMLTATLLIAVGLVWVGQGTGLLRGSSSWSVTPGGPSLAWWPSSAA